MFGYELQQDRQHELQRHAAEWRLARDVKAAAVAERRARRTAARAAVRTDAEGVSSAASPVAGRDPAAADLAGSRRTPLTPGPEGGRGAADRSGHRAGVLHRALHPRGAA